MSTCTLAPFCVHEYNSNLGIFNRAGDAQQTNTGNFGEECAVKLLPLFEKRAWVRTRFFFTINRSSRAAVETATFAKTPVSVQETDKATQVA